MNADPNAPAAEPVDVTFAEPSVQPTETEIVSVVTQVEPISLETTSIDVVPEVQTVGPVAPGVVTVVRATGKREVRGQIRDVELPYFNVSIDGRLAARTSLNIGKPIMTVAEVLPEEDAAVIAAVQAVRGDLGPVAIRRPPATKAVEKAFNK